MSLFPSSTRALESQQGEVQLCGGGERVWVEAGGSRENSKRAACLLFISTEGHGSVINRVKCCVASVRLLNLSEPQFPQAALQGDGLLLFGFPLGKESPTLPPFSAEF